MREEPALWLFADQLGPHFHSTPEHRGRDVLLIRSAAAFGAKPFHRQKLHLVQAALYRLAADLGDRVTLLDAPDYRTGLRRVRRAGLLAEPAAPPPPALLPRGGEG